MSIIDKLQTKIALEYFGMDTKPVEPVETDLSNLIIGYITHISDIIQLFIFEPADDFTRYQINEMIKEHYDLQCVWTFDKETHRSCLHVSGGDLGRATLSFTV